ncbi:hypothetical protein ACFPN2_13555 [Steroidobacter flavus]|uniref:Uncharacterized protein n=1 Tax=Steroidobacter flavus TaxID=1842136 RepID=A0ABV8SR64_9GAMM
MSAGVRIFLAVAAGLMGLVMFLHGTTAEEDKAWFSYAFGAFCMLIAAAAVLRGRAARFCGSLVGTCVFVAALLYLGHELATGPVTSGSRSQPSIVNAVLFLLVFGIPGLLYAIKARFGFSKSEPPNIQLQDFTRPE